MKSFFSILVLTIILASCGTSNSVTSNHFLQKRKYTKGWHFNNQQREISSNTESIKETPSIDASLNSLIYAEKTISNLIELKSFENSDCDTIILNDGKIVRVKILSTSDSTIHYSECESDDPTEFSMNKKEIKAIQYANGKFEFVKHHSAAEVHKSEVKQQKEVQKEKKITNKKTKRIWIWTILIIVIIGGSIAFVVSWSNGWG